jgi:DNA recombination protein RmuC
MDTSVIILTGLIVCAISFAVGIGLGFLLAKYRTQSSGEESRIRAAQMEAQLKAAQEKAIALETLKKQVEDNFSAVAASVLRTASGDLVSQSQQQIEKGKLEISGIVNPLKESLTKLDGNIRDLEGKREGAYSAVQSQVEILAKSNENLQQTTQALASAMKSPTARGRWGEFQLRRIVELANLSRHIDFEEQATGDEGRADMIIHLSNQGILPVDSKFSLTAYLEAMETQGEEEKKDRLQEHVRAMKGRINELGQKKYWEQFSGSPSPEFVVMFVPNESCLSCAMEEDPGLLEYAVSQKVILASPFTLLAIMRAVAYGWQQTQITENARQIAEQGKELYKRLSTFIGYFNDVRESLNNTVEQFNKVIGSMEHRLLPAARRFEEAGLSEEQIDAPEVIDIRAKKMDRE